MCAEADDGFRLVDEVDDLLDGEFSVLQLEDHRTSVRDDAAVPVIRVAQVPDDALDAAEDTAVAGHHHALIFALVRVDIRIEEVLDTVLHLAD